MLPCRFIARNLKNVGDIINSLHLRGIKPIIHYAGETSDSTEGIKKTVDMFPGHIIAIKCGPLRDITTIVDYAVDRGCRVVLDAERVSSINGYRKMSRILVSKYGSSVIPTYQMYLKDSLYTLIEDIQWYSDRGIEFTPKLVRGAYLHLDRSTGKLYTDISDTHKSYNDGIHILGKSKCKGILATHNWESCQIGMRYKKDFSYAQLMGFDKISDKIVSQGETVYVMIPWGPFMETIPYYLRRLYENLGMLKHI